MERDRITRLLEYRIKEGRHENEVRAKLAKVQHCEDEEIGALLARLDAAKTVADELRQRGAEDEAVTQAEVREVAERAAAVRARAKRLRLDLGGGTIVPQSLLTDLLAENDDLRSRNARARVEIESLERSLQVVPQGVRAKEELLLLRGTIVRPVTAMTRSRPLQLPHLLPSARLIRGGARHGA